MWTWNRSAFFLCLGMILLNTGLFAIEYSAFRHDIDYTHYGTRLLDNYTYPEPPQYPDVQDSMDWTMPIKSWKHMGKFATSWYKGNQDDFVLFGYRFKNADLDFYNYYQFITGMDGTFYPGTNTSFYYIGFNQQAWLNRHWSIHGQFTYSYIRGDSIRGGQSPQLDSFYKYYGRHYEFGNTIAGITYENNWLKAALGRGRLSMGNSITGNILLNDRVNEYPYFTVEVQVKHFIVSLMNAQLAADSTIALYDNHEWNVRNYPDKYFSAHQFTWRPIPEFDFYVGETIIYGNQGFSWNYILPQAYYRISADSEHDRDNATMHIGMDGKPGKNWLLYFQFMMDELRPEKLLKPWWGNKYAYQGGASYLLPWSPVTKQPSRITGEVTAIRPWTYTHYLLWDKYTNDKRCLGFPYGANLLHYALKVETPLPWYCDYTGYVSYMRQGSIGSNPQENSSDIFQDSYHNIAYWLQGKITNTCRLENSLRINVLKHQRFFLSQMAEKNNRTKKKWDNQITVGWQFLY